MISKVARHALQNYNWWSASVDGETLMLFDGDAAEAALDKAVVELMVEMVAFDYETEFGVRPHKHNVDIYKSRARELIGGKHE